MFSGEILNKTKMSVAKDVTTLIVSHLVRTQLLNENLFNDNWRLASVSVVVGELVHELFTTRLNKLVSLSGNQAKAFYDVIKYGTILLVKQLITNGQITNEWLRNYALMLTGYAIFNLFILDNIPKVTDYQDAIIDTVKLTTALILSDYNINPIAFKTIIASAIGFYAFHNIVKPKLL